MSADRVHPYPPLRTFATGERVAIHPATDSWLRGERFGTVTRGNADGHDRVHVQLDRSGRVRSFPLWACETIESVRYHHGDGDEPLPVL